MPSHSRAWRPEGIVLAKAQSDGSEKQSWRAARSAGCRGSGARWRRSDVDVIVLEEQTRPRDG